jgi:alpha-galactosidase
MPTVNAGPSARCAHHIISTRAVLCLLAVSLTACTSVRQPAPSELPPARSLTGNWSVDVSSGDGGVRKSYFNLLQQGQTITGSIRTSQFHYRIVEGTGGADGFKLVGAMQDGRSERRVTYEGRLVGDELRLATRRRPTDPLTEMVARPAPAGEGAMPVRNPLPARRTVPYNGLAKTPPMGWNSWNKFAGRVDDATVRGVADAMASNGMREAGYVYVNIDDTWEAGRDAAGNITTNKKFPDMKALADYVHGKGLKLGIYSSPGPNTCAGYEGSHGHERQDAATYAAWGIDYLKYDWCGARTLYTDEEMPEVYQIMGEALQATGRPIVYSLCQYGRLDVWKWGADVGGNLWRTTGDIRDSWDSMTRIGFGQAPLAQWAGPGHWNDPDMLEIGNGAMTDTEYRTHMSLWAMLAAPLLAGNDLRTMSPATLEILTNRDVIAVNQDPDGRQGTQAWVQGEQEIWTRPLAGGARAVAAFNRGAAPAPIAIRWADLKIDPRNAVVRDLWARSNVNVTGPEHAVTVPAHGVVMLRVGP